MAAGGGADQMGTTCSQSVWRRPFHTSQLGPTFTLKSERESCQTPPCQKYAAFAVNICKHTSAHTVLYTSSTPPVALQIQRPLSHLSSGCGKSFPPPLKDHFDSLARSPASSRSVFSSAGVHCLFYFMKSANIK